MMQRLSVILFGFGSFFILVRTMDKATYGTWVLYLTVTTFLELARNGLIQNSLVKFLAGAEPGEQGKIIAASFTLTSIVTAVCIILNVSLAHSLSLMWESPELEPMFYLSTIVYTLSGCFYQFQYIEQANLKFTGIFVATAIRQGFTFFYVLTCFIIDREVTLISLVFVQMVGTGLAATVSFLFARPFIHVDFKGSRVWMNKLLHYGKFVFGTSLSSSIFNSVDQMMLGAMMSNVAVGGYNIAVRITQFVEVPTASIAAIVFPQSVKRMESQGTTAIKYLYEKSVGVILAFLFPGLLFALIFPDFVVEMIAGENYPETTSVLQVTILFCLLVPFGRQFGTILDAINFPHINFMVVLSSTILNIILNFVMIRQYGVIGAAYASLLARIISLVVAQIILKKKLNVNSFQPLVYAFKFYGELYGRLRSLITSPLHEEEKQ